MPNSSLTTSEETGDNFSTVSMQNSIMSIQNDAVSQQVLLLNLKQRKLDIENDIKCKSDDLNRAKEEQRLLDAELKTQQMRLEEMEEQQTARQERIGRSREEVEDVRKKLAQEKEKQLHILKEYETKMASLSKKLISGPAVFNKENLSKKIALLRAERAKIHDELAEVERDLEGVKSQFLQLVSHDQPFEKCSGDSDMPSALKYIISQIEDDISSNGSDVQKLREELKTLDHVSTGLKNELKHLKNKC